MILALDIGGTAIKAGLIDDSLETLTDARELPSPGADGGEAVMARAVELAASYRAFSAVGVSTAGQVDPRAGAITYANDNIPGYTGMPVGARLRDALGVPVAIGNDAACAALGEAARGAARGSRDFLMLTFGTGIGGAVVAGGATFGGARFGAGQLGHIVTHADGLPCVCGGRGCWEQYASTSALVRSARRLNPGLADGRAVIAAAMAGDRPAGAAIDAWLGEVAAGIASLIPAFDPERVVLGGGIMSHAWLVQRIRELVTLRVMPPLRAARVVQAELGNQAALFGAATLAQNRGRRDHER